jgi:hypothetical protein
MELDPIDDDTILSSDNLPWDDIRMMFNLGEENRISPDEISRLHEALCNQIERIGCIVGEYDLGIRTCMEFFGDSLLCSLIEERALHREVIGSSVDICIVSCKISRYGIDHLFRLLRTRCGVEIDEIGMRREYREVRSEHNIDNLGCGTENLDI